MLDFGAKPTRPGIGLSLAKLNRVIDYPAADLTITVEAGMTLAELAKCLAAQRQRLPIDVPQPDRATVGGAMAANAAGPRRYAYGTIRDYVLGFTAVDGGGTIFSRRRPRGEECRRLQHVPLDGRLVGHAGRRDAGDADGPAAARGSALLVCDVARFRVRRRNCWPAWSPRRRGPWPSNWWPAGLREDDPVVGAGARRATSAGCTSVSRARRRKWIGWSSSCGASGPRPAPPRPMLVPTARAEPLWRWLAEFPADLQINVLPSATVETIAKAVGDRIRTARSRPMPATA